MCTKFAQVQRSGKTIQLTLLYQYELCKHLENTYLGIVDIHKYR